MPRANDHRALCVVNVHGTASRGADVIVDASLNPPGATMTVLLNTANVGGLRPGGVHTAGSKLPVLRRADGTVHVEIRDVPPSAVLVLSNHSDGSD